MNTTSSESTRSLMRLVSPRAVFVVLGVVALVALGLLYAATRVLTGKDLAVEEMQSQAACPPGWRQNVLGTCTKVGGRPVPTMPRVTPTPEDADGGDGSGAVPTPTPVATATPTPTPTPVPDRLPVSNFEGATCDSLWGWAYDPDTIGQSVDVHLYDGSRFVSAVSASVLRSDVNQAFGLTGNHGFNVALPEVFKDGQSHTIRAYAINTASGGVNPELTGSAKTIRCAGAITVGGVRFQIGEQEVVVSDAARKAAGLQYWPDSHVGVLPLGNGQYEFYAANSGQVTKFRGALNSPLSSLVDGRVEIAGVKQSFNYLAGGPVYLDPISGKKVLIYHAENWLGPNGTNSLFYSRLGMAVEGADGVWQDLGLIISPSVNSQTHAEIGGGEYQIVGDYMYVYFHDTFSGGSVLNVAVARASLQSLRAAVAAGQAPVFSKYYNGQWNQPGLGGLSTSFFAGNRDIFGWPTVIYDASVQKYIMMVFRYSTLVSEWDLYASTSSDGLHWADPQPIETEGGLSVYPTMIATGVDPHTAQGTFYVYYVYSTSGQGQLLWDRADVVRRMVTVR